MQKFHKTKNRFVGVIRTRFFLLVNIFSNMILILQS